MEHYFNTDIAKDFGIEEAILLHFFHFWLSKNAANEKHLHDGLYWFYNSKKAFVDLFPYMNETKIFRTIKNLEESGFVVKGNYNTDKWDRTNWYAITKFGLTYLQTKGYSISVFGALFQNDTLDSCKMNDGTLQSERPIPVINTYSNKENITIFSKKKYSLDLSSVSPQMMPVVEQWLAYKKEKGQLYKPTGFKTFYKKLCELSNNNHHTAMLIIEQSMQNNYAGIFPLRNNNNNGYARNKTNTDRLYETIQQGNEFSRQLHERIGKETSVDNGNCEPLW